MVLTEAECFNGDLSRRARAPEGVRDVLFAHGARAERRARALPARLLQARVLVAVAQLA